MKKPITIVLITVLILAVMSCGLVDRFTTGGVEKLQRAEALWPDVPQMDGLEHSDLELPMTGKLLIKWALDNMWRLNKEGEDTAPVSGDWVVFSSANQPADVQAYYTTERMTSFGNWEANKKMTCIDGKDKGWPGILCAYQKKDGTKDVGLLIFAGKDEKSQKTNVFFLRLEGEHMINSNSTKQQMKN